MPIPGTKRTTYLEANMHAAELTLTKQELDAIEEVFPVEGISGDRYHAQGMGTVNG